MEPDTPSYTIPIFPLENSLSHFRTLGYPVLLKMGGLLAADYRAMPWIHLGLFFLSVSIFFAGLQKLLAHPYHALLGSSGLLYFPLLFNWGNALMADVPASSFFLLALGVLFFWTAAPERKILGLAFSLAVFLSYQIHPSFLFLLGWMPLTGLFLRRIYCRRFSKNPGLPSFVVQMLLASVVPYLAFAFFRLWTVGHFGLVSFGGFSLIGVTGPFLEADLVRELPFRMQPFAELVLQKKKALEHWPENPGTRVEVMLYQVIAPAMVEYDQKQTFAQSNRFLTDFAFSLLKARPDLYAQWVWDSYRYGLKELLTPKVFWRFHQALKKLYKPAMFLSVPFLLFFAWTKRNGGKLFSLSSPAEGVAFSYALGLAFFLCLFYILAKLLLIVLVNFPFPRYLDDLSLFIPMIPMLVVFKMVQMALSGWSHDR